LKKKIIDFSKYSSIRIGGKVEVQVFETIEDLKNSQNIKIVGGANNLLISENPKTKLGVLSKNFDYINYENGLLKIGGATKNGTIFQFTKKNNLGGFEFLQHIPATLGGMVKMNAGVKNHEIFDNLIYVKTEHGIFYKENIKFGYRFSKIQGIITEAVFRIERNFSQDLVSKFLTMRSNQPKNHSAGSTFKNPKCCSAGKLIEETGLKGRKIGNMEFSKVHANFLVNLGNGRFEDAIQLIKIAEKKVLELQGVELEREIEIIF